MYVECAKYCGFNEADSGTLLVRLSFLREELLYDIKNSAYIEGHVLSDDMQNVKHLIEDIGENGNVDRVTRILNFAFASIVELLYPFTKGDTFDGMEIDDRLVEPIEYIINMNVPKDFSKTTINLLSQLIHEYLVYRVLYDWLLTAKPDSAAIWLSKTEDVLEKIKVLKNTRGKVLTRRMHPL